MIKYTLSAFLRKIFRKDIYSLINLSGLGIGIAACLIIFLYVKDELSYDRHNEHARTSYRLLLLNQRTGGSAAIMPAIMYDYLEGQLPGVESMARVLFTSERVIGVGQESFVEEGFIAADSSVFDILSFKFIHGDPANALSEPHSLILTEKTAEKYFGDKDPMGQTVIMENMLSYLVTGVIQAPPPNSHIQFSMMASLESMRSLNPSIFTNWHNQSVLIYMRLRPDVNPDDVAGQVSVLLTEANEGFRNIAFQLQPLLDIRLHSAQVEWDVAQTGDKTIVMIFSVIAIIILILACFNFVNLSVAMAVRRARETGIRKVLGARRPQLIAQFIAETFVMAFFAMLLALLLIELSLPVLNVLSGKALRLGLFSDPWQLGFVIGLLLIVSLFAGSYPAVVISRFKAIEAMRGSQQVLSNIRGPGRRKYPFRMRQLLMLLQFAVSTALIVASLTIFLQMKYLSDRHPGYQKEGLISIKNPYEDAAPSRAIWLKNQLQQHADVTDISMTHNVPTFSPNNYGQIRYESDDGSTSIHSAIISCDADYFGTLRSKFIYGRDFSADMGTDNRLATVINATAAARMGVDNPIGETLHGFYDGQARQVIGVVEDINFVSLHEPAGPMVFFISFEEYPWNWFNILLRYREGTARSLIAGIEDMWQEEAPQWPLQYHFLEERYMQHYQEDKRSMFIVTSFAILAVMLSVLGLVGLALYASTARTKEIGIRKVLGARVSEITRMITSEFGILVIISNLLAWPAAYLFIDRWLNSFAYRIDFNWLAFLLPALLVYLIASFTVGIISYRAANMNPVETLRNT